MSPFTRYFIFIVHIFYNFGPKNLSKIISIISFIGGVHLAVTFQLQLQFVLFIYRFFRTKIPRPHVLLAANNWVLNLKASAMHTLNILNAIIKMTKHLRLLLLVCVRQRLITFLVRLLFFCFILVRNSIDICLLVTFLVESTNKLGRI